MASRLIQSNNLRLKDLSKIHNVSNAEMITILLDTYELEDLNQYCFYIQRLRKQGIDTKKLNTLSILLSYLATIFQPYARK